MSRSKECLVSLIDWDQMDSYYGNFWTNYTNTLGIIVEQYVGISSALSMLYMDFEKALDSSNKESGMIYARSLSQLTAELH